MKKFIKKFLLYSIIIVLVVTGLLITADKVILPAIVNSNEYVVPDLVGVHKDSAMVMLEQLNLNPVLEGPRFDSRFEKDHVIFQNPRQGTIVKENRRVYIFISGGEPLVKMPNLEGKTLRNGKITAERLSLIIGEVEKVRSEYPADLIIGQNIEPGVNITKGDTVNLKVSVGPQVGKIRVPSLLGESLYSAEKILKNYSLKLGKITFVPSKTLLPNTIRDQYPNKDELANYGDSVDVFVARNIDK